MKALRTFLWFKYYSLAARESGLSYESSTIKLGLEFDINWIGLIVDWMKEVKRSVFMIIYAF
jgi:hypothetical protein